MQAIATITPELTTVNGKITTSSLQIAEVFHKDHAKVLRDIRALIEQCEDKFSEANFGLVEYTDVKGEKRPAYQITRDGFTLLAMGFTGKRALQFKLGYIEAFNKMEAALQAPTPTTIKDTPLEGKLYQAVCERTKGDGKARHWLWGHLNTHFGLATYKALPSDKFNDAIAFIASASLPALGHQAVQTGQSHAPLATQLAHIEPQTLTRINMLEKETSMFERAQALIEEGLWLADAANELRSQRGQPPAAVGICAARVVRGRLTQQRTKVIFIELEDERLAA